MRLVMTAALFALVASLSVTGAGSLAEAADTPNFDVGDLPPEEAKAAPRSLYDALSIDDVSPLGTPVGKVPADETLTWAASYINGDKGHQANEKEAAFWLKRSVAVAPDPTGKRRAWALMRLGLIEYKAGGAQGHAAARSLWELAAAWQEPTAMCNLGTLLEKGDDASKADRKAAVVWYERARSAGCKTADAALERLRR